MRFPRTAGLCSLSGLLLLAVLAQLPTSCRQPLQERDTVPPVISLLGSPAVTADIGVGYVDAGATAVDDVDGDLTGKIVVSSNVDCSRVGAYVVAYNVSDSSGNHAEEVRRDVAVRDPAQPVIILVGDKKIFIAQGKQYLDRGATAVDDVDGDLTHLIVVSNPVNTGIAGTYVITYNVTDTAGNSALEVTREVVVDGSAPVISLIGEATVLLAVDETWRDPGATAVDDVDGDISGRISKDNPVNRRVPGIYVIRYNVSDTAGNAAVEVTREVTVRDLAPPVITLRGSAKIITTIGIPFADPGATAPDNVDGDLSSQIVVVNPVDVTTAGVYFLTYDVRDAAGNQAIQVRRQIDVVVFSTTFGTYGRLDCAWALLEVPGNSYVVVGTSESSGLGIPNIRVLKLDGLGSPIWDKVIGEGDSVGLKAGTSLCAAADGNYLVAGSSRSRVDYTCDAWVIKLDASGNQLWLKALEGLGSAGAHEIIQSSDGGLLLTGSTCSSGGADDQLWVAKLDASGNQLWSRAFGGTGDETGEDIIQSGDGNYVIVGSTTSFGAGSYDVWVLKVDANGNELWSRSFGGVGNDSAWSLVEDSNGHYLAAGQTKPYGSGAWDAWVVKLDRDGNELWSQAFGGSLNESFTDIIPASAGGYLLAGTRELNSMDNDLWVVKLDGSGAMQWERAIGGWKGEAGASIIETADGYLAVAGRSSSYGDMYDDLWVIKF